MKELILTQIKNMAHNLEITDKGVSFFAVKEPAWHNLGKVFTERLTSDEAIKASNMNFEVGLLPVYGKYPEGTEGIPYGKVPDVFATYRKDNKTIFGAVGNRYEVVQNDEAFEFMDSIILAKAAMYETAGVLGNGHTIFISAKLPEIMTIGQDAIEKYLLLTMTHDGTSSIQVMFTPVRVVCNNTLTLALEGAQNIYRMVHTKNVRERMEHVANTIRAEQVYSDIFVTRMTELQSQFIPEIYFRHFLHFVFNRRYKYKEHFIQHRSSYTELKELSSTRTHNLIENIVSYAYTHSTQKLPGLISNEGVLSGYGAINAITGYFQNQHEYKDNESKFISLLSGRENGEYGKISKLITKLTPYILHGTL